MDRETRLGSHLPAPREGGSVMRTFRPGWRGMPTAIWLSIALLLVSGEAAARRDGQPFQWSGTLAAGQRITIHGINGNIRAERAPGNQVVVEAEKWSNWSDPEQVKIEVRREDGDVEICARYPRAWFGGLTDCEHLGSTGNNDVQVRFRVLVPAGVEARLMTVNGAIQATGLDSPISARTINGSVYLDTSDEAEASTINGSIVARARPRGEDLSFRTVNGSIRLELPANASADVYARTVNGGMHSDFPVHVHRSWMGQRLSGTLGRGGPDLHPPTCTR